ncbi:12207_t:CDS:2 [Cetraspora pellucida]|uniref:12207_t:CDS:1 n=1 Tax=Cetraspora pellucida TaxID=1433469 RepID=A0A9N9IX71_9GLOM|nr:12207_t:CDS:2 [Cetraspora pellucida]
MLGKWKCQESSLCQGSDNVKKVEMSNVVEVGSSLWLSEIYFRESGSCRKSGCRKNVVWEASGKSFSGKC